MIHVLLEPHYSWLRGRGAMLDFGRGVRFNAGHWKNELAPGRGRHGRLHCRVYVAWLAGFMEWSSLEDDSPDARTASVPLRWRKKRRYAKAWLCGIACRMETNGVLAVGRRRVALPGEENPPRQLRLAFKESA